MTYELIRRSYPIMVLAALVAAAFSANASLHTELPFPQNPHSQAQIRPIHPPSKISLPLHPRHHKRVGL